LNQQFDFSEYPFDREYVFVACDTGMWCLQNNKDVWTEWVPEDVAERVKQALDGG